MTVRIKHSKVRTKKTEGLIFFDTDRASEVNKLFIIWPEVCRLFVFDLVFFLSASTHFTDRVRTKYPVNFGIQKEGHTNIERTTELRLEPETLRLGKVGG